MTVDPAMQLAAARTARKLAQQTFDAHRTRVEEDLEARGVGGRIADRITETATDVMDEAVEVADEHRVVIAGTAAAIVAWFLRKPIIRWLSGMFEEVKERISR